MNYFQTMEADGVDRARPSGDCPGCAHALCRGCRSRENYQGLATRWPPHSYGSHAQNQPVNDRTLRHHRGSRGRVGIQAFKQTAQGVDSHRRAKFRAPETPARYPRARDNWSISPSPSENLAPAFRNPEEHYSLRARSIGTRQDDSQQTLGSEGNAQRTTQRLKVYFDNVRPTGHNHSQQNIHCRTRQDHSHQRLGLEGNAQGTTQRRKVYFDNVKPTGHDDSLKNIHWVGHGQRSRQLCRRVFSTLSLPTGEPDPGSRSPSQVQANILSTTSKTSRDLGSSRRPSLSLLDPPDPELQRSSRSPNAERKRKTLPVEAIEPTRSPGSTWSPAMAKLQLSSRSLLQLSSRSLSTERKKKMPPVEATEPTHGSPESAGSPIIVEPQLSSRSLSKERKRKMAPVEATEPTLSARSPWAPIMAEMQPSFRSPSTERTGKMSPVEATEPKRSPGAPWAPRIAGTSGAELQVPGRSQVPDVESPHAFRTSQAWLAEAPHAFRTTQVWLAAIRDDPNLLPVMHRHPSRKSVRHPGYLDRRYKPDFPDIIIRRSQVPGRPMMEMYVTPEISNLEFGDLILRVGYTHSMTERWPISVKLYVSAGGPRGIFIGRAEV